MGQMHLMKHVEWMKFDALSFMRNTHARQHGGDESVKREQNDFGAPALLSIRAALGTGRKKEGKKGKKRERKKKGAGLAF